MKSMPRMPMKMLSFARVCSVLGKRAAILSIAVMPQLPRYMTK